MHVHSWTNCRRRTLLAGLLALILALSACAEPGGFQPSPQAPVGPARPARVSWEGHHPGETLNQLPVETGPVPQDRGMDKRPGELLPPVEDKNQAMATIPAGTLVLYDKTGAYGWLGELYAIVAQNLATHFGTAISKPVASYVKGDLAKYKAVIYIGSTYDEPLPVAFLDDVLVSTVATQVVWIYNNIWQLANRSTNFVAKYGYNPWVYDNSAITTVTYKGTDLTRDPLASGGIMSYSTLDPALVTTVAAAKKADGTTIPWAVRSVNLTYVGENPFAYISANDRYLAFCDMLYDALAPTTPVKHRALVRLEDVSPNEDPVQFRAVVDYLAGAGVPFSIALIPLYKDPLGYFNGGVAETIKWTDRPQMVSAIKYATTKGGTIVMHGYTHQTGSAYNPYSGVTADDFEFYQTHIDANNSVIYDGALAGDSSTFALGRVNSGLTAIKAAGFTAPTIFEYPHYAGSPTDSKAIKTKFATAYHRGLYFTGGLGLNAQNLQHSIGQFVPYKVTDIYGWKLLPENLGNYEPEAYNNHPPRLPADLVNTAKKNLVIRDGVASFFFHPYYPLSELKAIVEGVKAAGYTFVAPNAL